MRELKSERSSLKIEKLMGEGQSAKVYRAIREDSRGHSRQVVALKILKNEKQVSWLRREFDTLARVRSSHCVQVLGWENTEEGCALVLEWIDGISLLELCRSYRLSRNAINEILYQAQEGLKALESAGLNHGDLSPSNILIDRAGRVCLVDFATAPAQSDFVIGTPAYLAPELWSGCPRGFSADLFALGMIEFDMNSSFSAVPSGVDESRKRSIEVSLISDSSFLKFEPTERKYREIESNESARKSLAFSVQQLLDTKADIALKTAALAAKRKWIPLGAACILLSAMIALPSGHALAPLLPETSRGALQVRSLNWVEIKLNGKSVGYSPVSLKKISAGTHRLEWKTQTRSGQMQITVQPGQTLSLTENDLLNTPSAVR